ncbi:MAG: hypothetical protein AAFR56_15865, partial [Chloroflexota bacterium]
GRIALNDERDIQELAIWALGEIGGDLASKVLDRLETYYEEQEDDAMLEVIEEAVANASLAMSMDLSDVFGLPDYGDEDNYPH